MWLLSLEAVIWQIIFYSFFQANEDSISSCGKRLPTASTVSPLPPLSTKRSSVAMVDLVPISNQWSKSEGSCDQQTFLTQVLICLILVLVTSFCLSSRAEICHQLVCPSGDKSIICLILVLITSSCLSSRAEICHQLVCPSKHKSIL